MFDFRRKHPRRALFVPMQRRVVRNGMLAIDRGKARRIRIVPVARDVVLRLIALREPDIHQPQHGIKDKIVCDDLMPHGTKTLIRFSALGLKMR